MQTVDGRLIVVGGMSRCGKTALVAADAKKARRVCAWDPEDQWAQLPGWRRVTTREQLKAAMLKPGPARIAYVTGGELAENFQYWAEAVYYAGRYVEPLAVIAEELADVTSPGKAAGKWGELVRKGLKRGITIYAISQRWAEADKTAMNNVTEFWLVQTAPMDVDYMAKRTGISREQIGALRKVETAATITCQYLKLQYHSRQLKKNQLDFKRRT